jgi:hypothetical protein
MPWKYVRHRSGIAYRSTNRLDYQVCNAVKAHEVNLGLDWLPIKKFAHLMQLGPTGIIWVETWLGLELALCLDANNFTWARVEKREAVCLVCYFALVGHVRAHWRALAWAAWGWVGRHGQDNQLDAEWETKPSVVGTGGAWRICVQCEEKKEVGSHGSLIEK